MLLLKGGLATKTLLVVLGLGLGAGGIAAGSQLGLLHHHPANRRVIAAQVLAIEHQPGVKALLLRVETRSGVILTIAITPTTTVKYKGGAIPASDLTVGTRFVGTVRLMRDGVAVMAAISVTRFPTHSAQAP